MRDGIDPIFNDIRIDLRNYQQQQTTGNDQRPQGSVPSRIARYSGK